MTANVIDIPAANLALVFVPVVILLIIMLRWSTGAGAAAYALGRMLLQLVAIGYLLTFIFAADSAALVLAILCVMLGAAGWIAIRPLGRRRPADLLRALAAIATSGLLSLGVVSLLVLEVTPWYLARVVIPLGGMIFASAMNAVSIAAERLAAELGNGGQMVAARDISFKAAINPFQNQLLAVGLVSLPGMMTGQILSGVDPLIAVRYQIMVMGMLYSGAGLAAAIYLQLVCWSLSKDAKPRT